MRSIYFILLVLVIATSCKTYVYKYSSTLCEETKDIYLIETKKQLMIYVPYFRSEFEDSHERLPSKSFSEVKSDNSDQMGISIPYGVSINDSIRLINNMYLASLLINQSRTLFEDTTILKSIYNDGKLIFSEIRDTSFFVGNKGFIKANCFDFFTDSIIDGKIYGYGKVLFVENKPLYFSYILNGKIRSSTDGFECVSFFHRRRLNYRSLKMSLW